MKKILIIEDNIEIRENTAELLELYNYTVVTATNGRIGFNLAKKFQPDVILCDMLMPETDGFGFLKLAKDDVIVRHIPLVFFSANSTSSFQRGFLLRDNGYLQKPFTEEELVFTIKSALDKKSDQHL